mmetsp:Transcript_66129/g.190829  ORF Transcript_66129/g.190829 Transcript_66129/m.190829 type:complete len:217 (+) Transcript_66129:1223-1873(+)
MPGLQHLLQQALSGSEIAAFVACLKNGVVRDRIVRHTLGCHLAEDLQRLREILLQPAALDECRVQDRVLMNAILLHVCENVKRLIQATAFHTRVDHATVGLLVCAAALLIHLLPNLQDLLNISRLPVGLHQDPQGDWRGLDLQLTHPLHSRFCPGEIPQSATNVKQRVEKHVIHIPGLRFDKPLHKVDAPVDARQIQLEATVADRLHQQPRDAELV